MQPEFHDVQAIKIKILRSDIAIDFNAMRRLGRRVIPRSTPQLAFIDTETYKIARSLIIVAILHSGRQHGKTLKANSFPIFKIGILAFGSWTVALSIRGCANDESIGVIDGE